MSASTPSAADPVSHVEVESKLTVPPDAELPNLSRIVRGGEVEPPRTERLRAVYFDTVDLSLLRAASVLRRREGGEDEGWHVKTADAADPGVRRERRWPLDAGQRDTPRAKRGPSSESARRHPGSPLVPEAVADEVATTTAGAPLVPIAVVDTVRTVVRVRDARGRLAVEVADDRVRTRAIHTGARKSWREWEAELGEELATDRRRAGRVSTQTLHRLTEAGAAPSSSPSKLQAAIGRTSARTPVRLGEIVHGTLAAHAAQLARLDPDVRRNAPDAVHQARVLVRRIRSLLDVYREVFDPEAADALRRRLRGFGRRLGTVRDAEVRLASAHSRVAAARGDEDEDAEEASAAQAPALQAERELIDSLAIDFDRQHRRLVTYLDSNRHAKVLRALERAVLRPKLAVAARFPAPSTLPVILRAAADEVFRLERRASEAPEQDREAALHEVRKAARRLRYAAHAADSELLPASLQRHAARIAKAAKRVQDVLGDHRDDALFADHVSTLVDEASSDAEAQTLQTLREASEASAARHLADAPRALAQLRSLTDRLDG